MLGVGARPAPATIGREGDRNGLDSARYLLRALDARTAASRGRRDARAQVAGARDADDAGPTVPSYQVLYGFQGLGSSDGVNPQSGVIEVNGVLYGTTQNGTTIQNPGCTGGCGTVYSLTTGGLEAVIYNFTSAGGANPVATLTAVNGALWGTTTTGGTSAQNGTVFGLAASGPVMYTFQGSPDGSNPQGAMVYDGKSNLYGTTVGGGTHRPRNGVPHQHLRSGDRA